MKKKLLIKLLLVMVLLLAFTAVGGCGTIQLIDEVNTPAPVEAGPQYTVLVTHSDGSTSEYSFSVTEEALIKQLADSELIVCTGETVSTVDGEESGRLYKWELLINGEPADEAAMNRPCDPEAVCSFVLNRIDPTTIISPGTVIAGRGDCWMLFTVLDDKGIETEFLIYTDANTVLDALAENDLITTVKSGGGFIVKEIMGIVADSDVDGSRWALSVNNRQTDCAELLQSVELGARYTFVFEKYWS